MAVVTPTAKAQFIDAAGVPLAGGLLYTYIAGTTTPQATYTDSTSATANSNPIVLDSRGEANIWLSGSTYKFKLCDANNTEIWTVDNIAAPSTALSPVFTSNVTISDDSSGPALLISQAGAGAAIRVQDTADPDNSPFVVDTSGQVGIGTGSPANALDVAGGAIQISTSGGTARTVISADLTDSIFSVNDDRNFTVKTNATTRLTVNSTAATSTVPVVLPADPTTSLQAATKAYADTKTPLTRTVTAGTGLTGGGSLASDITLSIATGGVTATQLASDAVTTVKITDANVTTAKIADANITPAKLNGAQSGSAPIFGVRAWGSITSTAGINASGNISTVTRSSSDFTITFSTAMSDTNYAVVATIAQANTSATISVSNKTTSTCIITTYTNGGASQNYAFDFMVIR